VVRALSLALTFATGASGLVYEVAWQRYLATLLGSHSEATAAVLAIFLGGLSVGYSLFGAATTRLVERARRANRPPRLLLFYGAVEASIGVYALVFPWLFEGAQAVSALVPHGTSGAGFAFDVLIAALLIGPPSVLMGGTIPILTQALARGLEDSTRLHAFVYAFNTAGAFLGALAAGFVLVPWLGLVRLMYAVAAVNIAAGTSFAALELRGRAAAGTPPPPDTGSPRVAHFASYAAVALLGGFAMMGLQTVVIRVGALALGSSPFTFSMVVAVFVLCIALGSFGVSRLRRPGSAHLLANQVALAALAAGLYLVLPYSPYGAHLARGIFQSVGAAFYPYWVSVFLGLLAFVGPVAVLSGASLPLLFHHLRRQVGELGGIAGSLYSWNTVGSLLGALLCGYALLFWLDLHHVYRIAVAALVVAAGLLALRVRPEWRTITAIVTAAALAGVALLAPWNPGYLTVGLFRSREYVKGVGQAPRRFMDSRSTKRAISFNDDDPVSTVTVLDQNANGRLASRSLMNNGKSDGSTRGDYPTMGLTALIPALLSDGLEKVCVIGFGTGVSAGELMALDGTRSVTVAEISPAVMKAAPLFDPFNLVASRNPKLEVVVSDAYRALIRSDETYDLIVSEPSNPWVSGVEMVYTKEFLEVAKTHLAPGGVYAQWMHQYETDDESVQLVLRTYNSVFDHTAVWYTLLADLLILGINDPDTALDVDRIAQRAALPDFAAGLKRSGIESPEALFAHELLPLGVIRAAALEGPLHTILHPRLNHQAVHGFFLGKQAELPFTGFGRPAAVGRENSLLLRRMARYKGKPPVEVRKAIADQVCKSRQYLCVSHVAHWMAEAPGSDDLEDALKQVEAWERRQEKRGAAQALEDARTLLLANGDKSSVSPEVARRASQVFRDYYTHGAPLDPSNLDAVWGRCSDSLQSHACAEGRRRAKRLTEEGKAK
jgi:predicted membrane-bound spermidine synthase